MFFPVSYKQLTDQKLFDDLQAMPKQKNRTIPRRQYVGNLGATINHGSLATE